MDRRLFNSAVEGGVSTFLSLVRQDDDLIKGIISGSSDTVLHLAARFGHLELASEILDLRPELLLSVNEKLETPLYEASREGRVEILKLFLEVQPCIAFDVNRNGENVLFVACESGKLDVVKFLLGKFPLRLMMESHHTSTTLLHAASSGGHTDVVKEILKVRPEFAWRKDSQGCTPLHLACIKGHLEITRELLRLDPNLTFLQDNDGRTPLHWAEMKGHENIVAEIFSMSHQSAEMKTSHGGTLSPEGWKNHPREKTRNMPDDDGNLVTPDVRSLCQGWALERQWDKHLLVAMNMNLGLNVLIASMTYLAVINPPGGFKEFCSKAVMGSFIMFASSNTLAFFIAISTVALHVNFILCEPKRPMVKLSAIFGKLTSMALIFLGLDYVASAWTILPKGPNTMWVLTTVVSVGLVSLILCLGVVLGKGHVSIIDEILSMSLRSVEMSKNHGRTLLHTGLENSDIKDLNYLANQQPNVLHIGITSFIMALLVSTTIAAVTVAPVFNQTFERAMMIEEISLKVFMVCNFLAMFLFVGTVILLIGGIPLREKSMKKVLASAHKVFCVALTCMTAAYIAAMWKSLEGSGANWVWGTVGVGVGITMGIVTGPRISPNSESAKKMGM